MLHIKHSNTSFLFTGDISPNIQNLLAVQYPELITSLDVLKLPHHGDILDASFKDLVAEIHYPVLLVGKNKYNLPKFDTLKFFGERILRSDCCTTIILKSDGESVTRITPWNMWYKNHFQCFFHPDGCMHGVMSAYWPY